MAYEELPQGDLRAGRYRPECGQQVLAPECITLGIQRTELVDDALRPPRRVLVALYEDPVATGADGYAEGLFYELEVPGEAVVKEGKLPLRVELYL